MTIKQINESLKEARRFIETAERAIDRIARESPSRVTDQDRYLISGSKETAACRRASLDLTRALADMRR